MNASIDPTIIKDIEEIVDSISDFSEQFSGKNILLAGGMGFLGRYFQYIFSVLNDSVLSKPATVVVIDNLITSGEAGKSMPQLSNITHVSADISKNIPIDAGLSFDYVVNLAGIASPFYYRAYPVETLDVAINGTRNLLDLARSCGARFVFFSSSEIYGDPDPRHVPTPESYRGNVSCKGPRSCYDESKRVGETLCYIYHTSFGVHTNAIRPFNVYGPGMQQADYRVLPNFASCIARNKPLKLYGTGNQTRTFCYITDAINGFLRVMALGVAGESYNIGNPSPEITIHQLASTVAKLSSRPILSDVIEYPDSYPADEPMRRCPDITKATLQLSYSPKVDIEEGLNRFLSWTSKNYTSAE